MTQLFRAKSISPYQFAVFRIVFGLYLTAYFLQLYPYADELFSSELIIGNSYLNPLHSLFPNPLAVWDDPLSVRLFVACVVLLSLAFAAGVFRRSTAILLWFAWACLFNHNNLIANLGPYVGLLLLLCALLPPGDRLNPFSLFWRSPRALLDSWQFPGMIYWTAWILLAAGYTFSGVTKLTSPSWLNGEAMRLFLENPLTRDGVFLQNALSLPSLMLKLMTWGVLGLEIVFLFASFSRLTRLWFWTAMICIHLGVIFVIDSSDLALGILMIHLFVLDPEWFLVPEKLRGRRNVVFFDGVCIMCNATVRFLSTEDYRQALYFATLQGETYGRVRRAGDLQYPEETASIVFVESFETSEQKTYTHSTAVARILLTMGGFWRLQGIALTFIPQVIRDCLYRVLVTYRYQWFGKTVEVCELPTEGQRKQMLP